MGENSRNSFSFGEFILDSNQKLLLRNGEIVKLPAKTFELLAYLVENPNRVINKAEIMEAVWQDSIVEEANLTVHISTLRKVLGNGNGEQDGEKRIAIETFPKVGYRLNSELTPIYSELPKDGDARNSVVEVSHTHRFTSPRTKRVAILAFGVAAASLVGIVLIFYFLNENRRPPVTSIAIIPFHNATGSVENDFLADGVTEMLIRQFSHHEGLSVKARSSVFRYRGSDVDPVKAGRDLSAGVVLVGRLKALGGSFLFDIELVDVGDGSVLWTGSFLSHSDDLTAVVAEMASTIRDTVNLGGPSTISRASGDLKDIDNAAYLYYLRGRYHWNRRNNDDFRKGIEYFQRSIEIEPNFALAYSGLSDSYVLLIQFGGGAPSDLLPQARSAARKAIDLDENCAEAHASLGNIAQLENDQLTAESEFRRAIELNPNYATAFQWLAELLSAEGQTDQADELIRKALELDPLSRIVRNIEARNHFWAGNLDRAVELLDRNIVLDPTWGGDHDLLFHVYEAKGMYSEAFAAYLRAQDLVLDIGQESDVERTRAAFEKGGWLGFVRHRVNHLEERSERSYVKPLVLAEFYARLDDRDKAFGALNEALSSGHFDLAWVKRLSCFDSLRDDPRYTDLLRKASSGS